MNAQMKFGNVDEMIQEAGDAFRKGVGSLSEWSEHARALMENKPALILGAASLSGFIAGALIRGSLNARRGRPSSLAEPLPVDPSVLLAGGLAIGLSVGPRLIQEGFAALQRFEQGGGEEPSRIEQVDGARLRTTGSMNEKPFEKP